MKKMEQEMLTASENMEFERAAALRDKIAAIKSVAEKQKISNTGLGDADVIGFVRAYEECLVQMPELTGRQPDVVVACVGGGSNAMGIFYPYIDHKDVRLVGAEAAGDGMETGRHAASLSGGIPGVLHGNRTYLLQDGDGQIIDTHSVSAGLDYPGVGPEHAWLKDIGRAEYVGINDEEALAAFHDCCRIEGIIPALESSHALAYAAKLAPTLPKDKLILVNLSGRGDKDMHTVARRAGIQW
jgi:tryptophan synthase beta chain